MTEDEAKRWAKNKANQQKVIEGFSKHSEFAFWVVKKNESQV